MKFCDNAACTPEAPCATCQRVILFAQEAITKIDALTTEAILKGIGAMKWSVKQPDGSETFEYVDEQRCKDFFAAYNEHKQAGVVKLLTELAENQAKESAQGAPAQAEDKPKKAKKTKKAKKDAKSAEETSSSLVVANGQAVPVETPSA